MEGPNVVGKVFAHKEAKVDPSSLETAPAPES